MKYDHYMKPSCEKCFLEKSWQSTAIQLPRIERRATAPHEQNFGAELGNCVPSPSLPITFLVIIV